MLQSLLHVISFVLRASGKCLLLALLFTLASALEAKTSRLQDIAQMLSGFRGPSVAFCVFCDFAHTGSQAGAVRGFIQSVGMSVAVHAMALRWMWRLLSKRLCRTYDPPTPPPSSQFL